MIPATRHDALRRWLWEHGFSFAADRPVQAAGRWYAVMAAEYTGRCIRPPLPSACLAVRENGPREKATPTGRRQSCPGCALACRMAVNWQRKSIVY